MPLTKKQKELFLAVYEGDATKVEVLLSSRVKTDIRDENNNTPLHSAINKPDIVGILLEHKADTEAESYQGKTPLHFAAEIGVACSVDLLVKAGANVNAKDGFGWTPLQHLALHPWEYLNIPAKEEVFSIVRLLLEAGANTNVKDREGITVLMDAAKRGNVAFAKLFVQHGADVNAKCNEGKTAFDCARGECKEWLLGLEKSRTDDAALDDFLPNDFPQGGKGGGL